MADEERGKGSPAATTVGCLTVAILAVLAYVFVKAYVFPAFAFIEKKMISASAGDVRAMNSALALYQADVQCKQFPVTLLQLCSDNAAGWSGPYVATISSDPWDNDYTFTSDGSNYTVQSVHDSPYGNAETIRYVAAHGMMESIP